MHTSSVTYHYNHKGLTKALLHF